MSAPGASPKGKIVVVDDDQVTLTMLLGLLIRAGYRVFTASDGETALEMISAERPGLVITDFLIPKMDGLALCSRIKADPGLARIPVVIMTAFKNAAVRFQARECKADGFVEKPLVMKDLLDLVAKLFVPEESR
jgi:CheY-like chemotaxis protein